MSDLKVLSVQKRAGLGKGANRRARQEELIPGVFYTAKGENLPVQMSVRSFAKLFSQVGRTTVFNLEIEGDGTHPVLIWATQRDPITSRFTHIDFYGVDLDKPVKITVPVEFTGVARGTKVGGKLETYREQIQLMAKPLDMPAKVTIDISGMDVGTTIQIADVKLPEGVRAIAPETPIATVTVIAEDTTAAPAAAATDAAAPAAAAAAPAAAPAAK